MMGFYIAQYLHKLLLPYYSVEVYYAGVGLHKKTITKLHTITLSIYTNVFYIEPDGALLKEQHISINY